MPSFSRPAPQSIPRSIFLSPHPDDAVLSCGGTIYRLAENGYRPIVITLFGGDRPIGTPLSDFARELHQRWQLGDTAPAARREEDRAACDRLGAMLIHLPFADAVYRVEPVTQRCLYNSEEAIFGPVRETDIIGRVAEALHSKLRLAGSSVRVFVPLTAGRHVDHVITRAAAERLKIELDYYEDYPYAEQPDRMAHVWGPTPDARDTGWRSEAVELSEDALQAKIDAFLCHRSQISTFYRDDDEAAQRLRAYAAAVGQGQPAERFWRQR
jgi:LmbE family N-acetylglucosaminyl deacetylase